MSKKCAGEYQEILEFFARYLEDKGRSENTIKTYLGVLQSFFNWLKNRHGNIPELSKNEIQVYMNYLESEQRSAATVEKVFRTLTVFARYINQPQITDDIYRKEKLGDKTAPESLAENEVEYLLREIEQVGNERNTAIVYTLLYTGIRVSELCSLNRSDIETGFITIKSRKDDDKGRTIPMSKAFSNHLKTYLESRTDSHEALFISNYQKRISPRTVQHMLKPYGVHPHKLRHTFCYELVQKGVDLSIIAELAGHSDINVTKQYVKLSKRSELEHAISKMFA